MNRPTYLIGGGYDKESSYDEWIKAFDGKVRCLVLIGQTKEKIKAAAERLGLRTLYFLKLFRRLCIFVRNTQKREKLFFFLPPAQAGDSLTITSREAICLKNTCLSFKSKERSGKGAVIFPGLKFICFK